MTRCLLISVTLFSQLLHAQHSAVQKLPNLTVDDKSTGYTLYTYQIPEDGYYSFSADGGLTPRAASTIYYCEYRFQLQASDKVYNQEHFNVASQAQDGNICYFTANEKNNKVGGVFKKGEHVQFRLVLLKSDVNGDPHKKLSLANNSRVQVKQISPSISTE